MKIFINLPTWLGDSVMASAALRLIFSHFERLSQINATNFGEIQNANNTEQSTDTKHTESTPINAQNTNQTRQNTRTQNTEQPKATQNLKFVLYGSFVACELFKACDNVEIFVQTPKKKGILGALARFKDFRKLARIWGEFNYAFSFRSAFSARFMLFLLRSKHKFIFDKKQNKDAHQVLKYLAFIENTLQIKAASDELFLPTPKFSTLQASEQKILLEKFGVKKDKKLLGINAGAKYGLAKCWEREYFAQVGLEFNKTHEILIFGVSTEQEICDGIESWLAQHSVKAHNLCAKTDIKELSQLISALDLFISNDSGAMHIAAAYKTPTIAVFGPTRFTQTSPWHNENAKLIHLNLACMPCMKRVCPLKHHACMKELKPELVINAAKGLLAR